jgi:hypothetical protein
MASPRRPISSVPVILTFVVKSFAAMASMAVFNLSSRGAISRVSTIPTSAQSRTIRRVAPELIQSARVLAVVASVASAVPFFALSSVAWYADASAALTLPMLDSD